MLLRQPTLATIITTARAGSLERSEAMFRQGGFADQREDPAALAVHGRLLKDRAKRLPEAQRPRAFAAAAEAYASANRLVRQPYTMINVATLTLLAGDVQTACAIAADLLAWLDTDTVFAETPYYLEATRAEALLLCGDVAGATAALTRAIAHDSDGWADHASTIGQLMMILDHQGAPGAWLDAFRPPRSLYFAGHLGIDAADHADLSGRIAAILREERIGFGFGALAAGADIVIAEALLAADAELHVFLPGDFDSFERLSAAPYGEEWSARYRRCLDAATSVRCFTQIDHGYQPLGTQLAADVAMGTALMNARGFESEAVQLLVIDQPGDFGGGLETARTAHLWKRIAARQHLLRFPRNAAVTPSGQKARGEGAPDLRLAALLHIGFEGLDDCDERAFAEIARDQLIPFRAHAAAIAVQPDLVLPAGNARIAAFADPQAAWHYATALFALPPGRLALRLAGHYGLAHWLDSPPALVGRALADLAAIAAGSIPGVLTVSDVFAAALQLIDNAPPRVEHVGEVRAMPIYSVTES